MSEKIVELSLELDYVYGYRARQAHNNVHWIQEPNVILYHAAAVCVVCDITTRTQKYFSAHEDDVLCLTYHPKLRIAASGGLGKRSTAPIFVWSVDTFVTKVKISGTLQFGVLAVAFSECGSRLFGVGSDTNFTVATFDVGTGVCLAASSGDKNRIVHVAADSTMGRDSKRNFVTVGVSHIKFWSRIKGKEEFSGKKAIGGDIATHTMTSVCCTIQHVVVGNVAGSMYIFSESMLLRTVQAHSTFIGSLASYFNTVYSGGRDGLIKQWNVELPDAKLERTFDLQPHSQLCKSSVLVDGKSKKRGNCPRAISVSNGKLLVGTSLSSIYVVHSEVDVKTVLEGHFEEAAGAQSEVWALDVHPQEPLFCSASDDCTLRLWSMELGSMILLAPITYPSRACAFSPEGSQIAVGHDNGAFSVWDAMTLTPILSFTRKRAFPVHYIRYSPDGRFLAMSMGNARVIDIYSAKRGFEYIGYCDAVSSLVKMFDFNIASNVIQCSTSGYDVLHFNIPDATLNQSAAICNERWASHSCLIGWGVQGIWEGCSDGTDINSCARSNCQQYLAVGYDSCKVRLYNFPCLTLSSDNSAKATFPPHRSYHGHSSHVTNIRWSHDDKYIVSSGGSDLTILRWKVVNLQAKRESTLLDYAQLATSSRASEVAQGIIRELGASSPRKPKAAPELSATLAKTTTRRPFSSNDSVRSRVMQPTTATEAKALIGKAQREHIMKVNVSNKRFANY